MPQIVLGQFLPAALIQITFLAGIPSSANATPPLTPAQQAKADAAVLGL